MIAQTKLITSTDGNEFTEALSIALLDYKRMPQIHYAMGQHYNGQLLYTALLIGPEN